LPPDNGEAELSDARCCGTGFVDGMLETVAKLYDAGAFERAALQNDLFQRFRFHRFALSRLRKKACSCACSKMP